MKYILLISFLCIQLETFAPVRAAACIFQPETIRPYERLVDAIVQVESGGNTCAYNPDGESVGAFQIRQCRLDDFNRLTGKSYQLEDMYCYDKAKEVFIYFACVSLDFEYISRKWNGSGRMTDIYWQKVKNKLK